MKQVFLVDGVRSPVGKFCGGLSEVRADDLAAHAIRSLLERNPGVDAAQIEEVILGCANQAGEDNRNVARMALLLAGMPHTVPGETVNRLCASGMSATIRAAHAAQLGNGDLFVAGGAESMTRGPFVMSKAPAPYSRNVELHDTTLGWRFVNPKMREMYGVDEMGQTAENLAEKFSITREDQDQFAAWSQQKAAAARKSGRLAQEIAPVVIPAKRKTPERTVEHDEFIREGTTTEILAKLKPAFRRDGKGSVTAGNASGLNDGSCALLVASEDAVERLGLTPRARIVSSGIVGVEPRIMGIGPVGASKKALQRAGLKIGEMDVIEINEAFAVQVLACLRELGITDDDRRVNPNGGAIAIGHPLGMSGARLLLTAMHQLHETGGKYALCALCVGVGQGMATIIEKV